jgi:hypothetical protein
MDDGHARRRRRRPGAGIGNTVELVLDTRKSRHEKKVKARLMELLKWFEEVGGEGAVASLPDPE